MKGMFPNELDSTKFAVKLMLGIVIGGFGGLFGLIGFGLEPVIGVIVWGASFALYKLITHVLFG